MIKIKNVNKIKIISNHLIIIKDLVMMMKIKMKMMKIIIVLKIMINKIRIKNSICNH